MGGLSRSFLWKTALATRSSPARYLRVRARQNLLPEILNAQVSIAVRIGPPPSPSCGSSPANRSRPDYLWVEGYWYVMGNRYRWHDGYWTRPPYPAAYWIPPHHDGERFYNGYWGGDRGRREHDYRWDRDYRCGDTSSIR